MQRLLYLLVAIVALIFTAGCPTGSSTSTSSSLDAPAAEINDSIDKGTVDELLNEIPGLVSVGETANAGSLDWTVTEIEWPKTVSARKRSVEAAGIYLKLSIEVELDEGLTSGHLDQGQISVVDSVSRRFFPHGDSFILGKESLLPYPSNPDTFIDDVITRDVTARKPISGKVLFDLPTDVTGLRLVIKDQRDLSEKTLFVRISEAEGNVRIPTDGMAQ